MSLRFGRVVWNLEEGWEFFRGKSLHVSAISYLLMSVQTFLICNHGSFLGGLNVYLSEISLQKCKSHVFGVSSLFCGTVPSRPAQLEP